MECYGVDVMSQEVDIIGHGVDVTGHGVGCYGAWGGCYEAWGGCWHQLQGWMRPLATTTTPGRVLLGGAPQRVHPLPSPVHWRWFAEPW